MNKIVRILGKKGRITIPYEMRMAMKIQCGDILSFSADGNRITIIKEKLCDNCKVSEPIEQFVRSLEPEEKEKLLCALVREKKRRRENV